MVLVSFEGRPVPPYAILSHTWEDDEVRFEDIFPRQSSSVMPTEKHGYSKIKYSCDQAQCDGLEFIWIDTCCINKSSSAELSEAINSMFDWYEKARVCYVYLFDLHRPNHPDITFEESRWFRRGWTLQELIAPVHVEFYDHQWMPLGDKGTRSRQSNISDSLEGFDGFEAILNLYPTQPENYQGNLVYRIESITQIPIEVLTLKQRPISRLLSRFPAAQRLSWAANRETARTEDRAYSLLGLFDINMSLLYGEGKEAFIRLQQQIMNRYRDQSLLAFTRRKHINWQLPGPLADDPAVFADSNIVHVPRSHRSLPRVLEEPFSYSWRHIDLQTYLCTSLGHDQKYALAILDCGYSDDPLSRPAIVLRRLDGTNYSYLRIEHSTLCRVNPQHLLNSDPVQVEIPRPTRELDADLNENTGLSFEENIVEFDVKQAPLTTIKLMIGSSSFTLDYGPLYVITPPTQIVLGPEYTLRFAWPRPQEADSSSYISDEKLPRVVGPLWLDATSDYDPDRVELKSVRDSLGPDALLSGLICIEQLPMDSNAAGGDAADAEEISEIYLVLWGLRRQSVPSAHPVQVSHGEVYPESGWCYVVSWEDVLDPSLAPLAEDILQLDLAGILTRIQAVLQLTISDYKEKWTVIRSRPGPASEVTAQISCLDFFGQETLQLRVESSRTDEE